MAPHSGAVAPVRAASEDGGAEVRVFANEIFEGIIKLLLFIIAGFMGLGLLLVLGSAAGRRPPPDDRPRDPGDPPSSGN